MCKCHTRVPRDFIDVFTVPPEAISVIGAMADASFLGGTDAQNIIACEPMFLTVRAISVNGYKRGNGPEHVNDAFPFVGQFIRTYAYRLFDLAATGCKHIRPQATAILTMCMDEFDRLDLPPPHLDISASVAAVARIVMTELKAQGVANVDEHADVDCSWRKEVAPVAEHADADCNWRSQWGTGGNCSCLHLSRLNGVEVEID